MSVIAKGNEAEQDWDADWEGSRRYHLTRCLDATPSQRLAWLEEMLELLQLTGALKRDGSNSG